MNDIQAIETDEMKEKMDKTESLCAPVMTCARHRLSVDGEGVTTLVLLAGCPLTCKYCLNDYCHDRREYDRQTPEALFERLRIDDLYFQATGGGVTFGGGEPMVYSAFIEAFYEYMLNHVNGKPWRLSIESSLHVEEEQVVRLLPIVDEWIVDVKDLNGEIYERYTGKRVDRLLQNLRLIAEAGQQERVCLRLPLIPEHNCDDDRVRSEQQLRMMGFTRFDRFDYIIKDNNNTADGENRLPEVVVKNS